MKIVTVVVTATPAATPTPVVITEVQTVVVTATAREAATTTPQPVPPRRASPTVAPTASPTNPPAPQIPTETRAAQPYKYQAPELITPVDTEAFTADGVPVLRWKPVGSLEPDEYYEVTIERIWQNNPYYAGSDWTRETEYIVPKAIVLNTSDTDTYTWWVTVKRLTGTTSGGGKVGETISPPSESRTFTWK